MRTFPLRESLFVAFALTVALSATSPTEMIPPTAVPIFDPNVEQAQRLQPPIPSTIPDAPGGVPTGPTVPTGVTSTAPRANQTIVDPPTPSVQLKLRTPSHVANGKPVVVKLTAVNASQANAYRVQIRVPFPEGAASISKCEPAADNLAEFQKGIGKPAELIWKFRSLTKGEQKLIEVEFTPTAGAKEIRTRGYVLFEHGSEVVTILEKPKLAVKKTATPSVGVNELATVRVEVLNEGTVTIPNARLVESVSAGAEFRGDRDSERGETPNQRIWQLGNLEPGQAKIVTYQMLGKAGGELVTTSIAASTDPHAPVQSEKAESKTKILVPALKLEFTGPATVAAREAATYTATVSNTGTAALNDVRVNVTVPEDCEVTKMTNGARRSKESVLWIVPTLPAGESRAFRVGVEAQVSGKKLLKAVARDYKSAAQDAQDVSTTFQGRADLTWSPSLEQVVIATGKQGVLTVKVKNQGGETEKSLRVRVELPDQVTLVQGSPNLYDLAKNELVFKPRKLAPGQTETYTVTYEAKTSGRAYFRMRLEADSLGDRPLLKEQAVEINNSR